MHSDTIHDEEDKNFLSNGGRMRIRELAKIAGVSRETIHFYLREGLLPPPEKVNTRVAYFDASHLARLRLIKRLQQVHLPLSTIKEHLEYVAGRSPEFLDERFIPRLEEFLDLDGEETELSLNEVAEQAGLTFEQVTRLEALGVLRTTQAGGHPYYTQADRDAAVAAKMLLDQGVAFEDLRFVKRYQELIDQENGFIFHHLILPALAAGRRDQVSAGRGFQALRTIESYLRRQIRREYGIISRKMENIPDPLDSR